MEVINQDDNALREFLVAHYTEDWDPILTIELEAGAWTVELIGSETSVEYGPYILRIDPQ